MGGLRPLDTRYLEAQRLAVQVDEHARRCYGDAGWRFVLLYWTEDETIRFLLDHGIRTLRDAVALIGFDAGATAGLQPEMPGESS